MDKEKQIEELAKLCCYPCEMYSAFTTKCSADTIPTKCSIATEAAKKLINAGYVNVKQAKKEGAKEFAEKLKENLECIVMRAVDESLGAAYEYINQLIKEFCGEE